MHRLREHYDRIPCIAIAIAPRNGIIRYANPPGAAVLRLTPAELIGRSAYDLRPDHADAWARLAHAARRDTVRELVELDGRWYAVTLWAYGDGVVAGARDVTDTLGVRAVVAHVREVRLAARPQCANAVVARCLLNGAESIGDICAETGLDQAEVGYAVRRLAR